MNLIDASGWITVSLQPVSRQARRALSATTTLRAKNLAQPANSRWPLWGLGSNGTENSFKLTEA